MNICLVHEYYPPYAPGGASWSTKAMAEALRDADQHVLVLTPSYEAWGCGGGTRFVNQGLHVHRCGTSARMRKGENTARYRTFANPRFQLEMARSIREIALALGEPSDIIHAMNKHSLPGAYIAARRLGIPIVASLRDLGYICAQGQCYVDGGDAGHPDCGKLGHWWGDCRAKHVRRYHRAETLGLNASLLGTWCYTKVLQWFLKRADGYVFVSNGIQAIYERAGVLGNAPREVIYNIPPEPIEVSHHEVADIRRRYGWQDKKVVLYAGRLSPGKGVPDLCNAAGYVAQRVPGALFVFAGTGMQLSTLRHIQWLGQVPHDELLRLYHAVDLVVIPSRVPEALSRVALEAMSAGRAIVATRTGGLPEEVADGYNGCLVPVGKHLALAEAIEGLLRDDVRRLAFGNRGRDVLRERFDGDALARRMIAFYQALA